MIASPRHFLICVTAVAMPFGIACADETQTETLPTVVIVGDSIRLSYAPLVVQRLSGRAIVVSPRANGGDSSNLLKNLDAWVINQKPNIVHFNCGIHDTKKFKATGKFQVSPADYEANLRTIVDRIRRQTGAIVLFATTTPILDDRAARARQGRDYELLGASVDQYNAIARKIMQELKVPINDLHLILSRPCESVSVQDLIGSDGVHLTPAAKKLLGEKVATSIMAHLPADEK